MTRIAVVGGGPAGFYATQALLRRDATLQVDLIERQLIPYGLVRYGVAPDHLEVKSKAIWFRSILSSPRVRYLGNVVVGRDCSVAELQSRYAAVLFSYGASESRTLGIDGESLPGSVAAAELVRWYNGHPDARDLSPPLDTEAAVITGMGNVTLDICRALLSDWSAWRPTDLAHHALASLRDSRIRTVHVLGRRGPSQASFSPKELVELSEVPGVSFVVDPDDIQHDLPAPAPAPAGDRLTAQRTRRNRELFAGWSQHRRRTPKQVCFHFRTVPTALQGEGRVSAVSVARTHLTHRDGVVRALSQPGAAGTLRAGLFVRSIGYRGAAMPGLPFDASRGVVPSAAGRVLDGAHPVAGCYVSGWIRRGPSGVIGTNKVDALEVVDSILADLPDRAPATDSDLRTLLASRGVRVVGKAACDQLERAERYLGAIRGRRAEKWVDTADALRFLDEVRDVRSSDDFVTAVRARLRD